MTVEELARRIERRFHAAGIVCEAVYVPPEDESVDGEITLTVAGKTLETRLQVGEDYLGVSCDLMNYGFYRRTTPRDETVSAIERLLDRAMKEIGI